MSLSCPAPSSQKTSRSVRRILIIDDHPIIRHGIAGLINAEPDLTVCGEAETAAAGLEAVRHLDPHGLLLDLSLPDGGGVDLLKTIKAMKPLLPILVISMHDDSATALRTLRAGALGYLTKAEAGDQVLSGVRTILEGRPFLSKDLSQRLIFQIVEAPIGEGRSPEERLTPRETEVLDLLGHGFGTREVAARLGLSVKTVETHRGHIKDKFLFQTSAEMIRFAAEWVAQKE